MPFSNQPTQILPGSDPSSALLSTSTAVAIIWSLWFILVTTVAFSYYAFHVDYSRGRSSSKPNSSGKKDHKVPTHSIPSCSSPSASQRKATMVIVFFILFLATIYILGTTFTIVWQERLDIIMKETLIHYGGDVNTWAQNVMMEDNTVNSLRQRLGKFAIALSSIFLTISWSMKGLFLVLFWGVAEKLKLGDQTYKRKTACRVRGRENLEKLDIKQLPKTPRDRAARAAYLTLFTTTVIIVISYPLLLASQGILYGIILGRDMETYSLDTTLPSAYIMLITIFCAIFNIPTTTLLVVIPILLFRALRLRKHQLRGASLTATLAFMVIVIQFWRLIYTLVHGASSFVGPGPEARRMSNWENVERGLDEKTLTVLELCLSGLLACGPGLRIFMRKCKRSKNRGSSKQGRDLEKGNEKSEKCRDRFAARESRRNKDTCQTKNRHLQMNSSRRWCPNYNRSTRADGFNVIAPDNSHSPTESSDQKSPINFMPWRPLNVKKSSSTSFKQCIVSKSRPTTGTTWRKSISRSLRSCNSRIGIKSDKSEQERFEGADNLK